MSDEIFDLIISETIENYFNSNLLTEDSKSDDKEENENDEQKDEKKDKSRTKKKKKFRKNAIKGKGGLRKDFDVEDDETYNQNVDDQEQSAVEDVLKSGYINVKKVAEKLYPDHTAEGAQSQLRKKLEGEHSDSGSKYRLKNKEVKKLRHIIAAYLNN